MIKAITKLDDLNFSKALGGLIEKSLFTCHENQISIYEYIQREFLNYSSHSNTIQKNDEIICCIQKCLGSVKDIIEFKLIALQVSSILAVMLDENKQNLLKLLKRVEKIHINFSDYKSAILIYNSIIKSLSVKDAEYYQITNKLAEAYFKSDLYSEAY